MKIFATAEGSTPYKIDAVHFMNLVITKIMKGSEMLWGLVSSCFGSGTWYNNSKWSNLEFWKN